MSLELRWPASRFWYGRVEINGRRRVLKLGVRIQGLPPPSLLLRGDEQFEASREKAQRAYVKMVEELKERGSNARLLEKLISLRSGDEAKEVPVVALFDEWNAIPREAEMSPRHVQNVKAMFSRFSAFVSQTAPTTKFASLISARMAERFMESETKRGVSAKTFNEILGVLRRTFEHLGADALIAKNPFLRVKRRKGDTTSRLALLPEQVKCLLSAAEQHPFIRPLVIVGLCTAMRRSDCCHLAWEHIDLERGTIRIKTRKTKETVTIPIFPLLGRELVTRRSQVAAENLRGFVFPELAQMDEINPDGLTWRYEQLLKSAGFSADAVNDATQDINATRQKRVDGLRVASVRGFHALRTTWVTFALLAGVPVDVIRLVTGHRAVEVVTTHYFQPNAVQYRHLLESRMPTVLTGAEDHSDPQLISPAELLLWIQKKLELMTAESWPPLRQEVLSRIAAQHGSGVIVPVLPALPATG